MSLAGCRGGAPAGVWGSAPTAARATNSKGTVNKGAGSEASLPLTLRVLRRAPNLRYQPLAHCRAKWARPNSRATPANGADTPMQIALFSALVRNKDIPHNLAAMTAAIAQAAADGADLVVFGESTLQGFDCLCLSLIHISEPTRPY